MSEEESAAIECFARQVGVPIERGRTSEGYQIYLGMSWRFDDFDEAIAFLAPLLPGREEGEPFLLATSCRLGQPRAFEPQTGFTKTMLTREDIRILRGITAALKIPFRSSQDSLGLIAHFESKSPEQGCVCRTLREAVSALASHASYSVMHGEAAGRQRIAAGGERVEVRERAFHSLDLLTGSD